MRVERASKRAVVSSGVVKARMVPLPLFSSSSSLCFHQTPFCEVSFFVSLIPFQYDFMRDIILRAHIININATQLQQLP